MLVFLSHIHEEQPLARLIKDFIDTAFLGLTDVFVSSDDRSLGYGDVWLGRVTHALEQCKVQLVLCSPQSVKRPWINFEAGACWLRKIPVIPICHSGMTAGGLPTPLSALQSAKLANEQQFRGVIARIAKALKSHSPGGDYKQFLQSVLEFEQNYTFWNEFGSAFNAALRNTGNNGAAAFTTGGDSVIGLRTRQFDALETGITFLSGKGLVTIRINGGVMDNQGMLHTVELFFTDRYRELIKQYFAKYAGTL